MAGFFGQSFGDFKDRIGGLLSDPQQAHALTANPWVGIGTGLLSGKGAVGALSGLAAAKQQMQSDEDRERLAKLREQLSALIQQQAGAVPGQPPPSATEQAMQMSLNPGQPGSSLNVPGATPPIMPQMGGGGGFGGMQGGMGPETLQLLQQLGWSGVMGR